ncbi:hypothetical protein J3A64_002700 [Pseudarthrobacter sp. PvP004]|nr:MULTISPECIES: hypothetical protein [Micrococcaceae]MBP2267236.1 hypothetical protein [Pseudarthrobacter sp. PvP004]
MNAIHLVIVVSRSTSPMIETSWLAPSPEPDHPDLDAQSLQAVTA